MLEPKDRQPSKEENEKKWLREKVAQIEDLRIALDNLFQHVAAIARLTGFRGITPKKLVKESRNTKANYEFLIACMAEEQRLNAEAQAKAKAATEEFNIKQEPNATNQENTEDGPTSPDTRASS